MGSAPASTHSNSLFSRDSCVSSSMKSDCCSVGSMARPGAVATRKRAAAAWSTASLRCSTAVKRELRS